MQSFTAKGAESELELMKSCTSPILPQTPTSHPNALEERKNQRFFLFENRIVTFSDNLSDSLCHSFFS